MKYLEINWQQQWELHAEGYKEGRAHISLSPYGIEKECILIPGAGFGDLSHPTTRLMLQLMAPLVKGKTLIDIGSGSGILSLCGLLMGARKAIGIEIDSEAVQHAKENALINQLNAEFHLPEEINPLPGEDLVILMNMISSEQKIAWPAYQKWAAEAQILITSGILSSDQNNYLHQTRSWGWSLTKSKEENEWIGFVFEK